MLKAKDHIPAAQKGLSDTDENRLDDVQSMDIFTRTISSLQKKVYRLEQELIQIQHYAYHDELTGLPNRNLLKDRVNQALKNAARNKTQVGLLLLDLNGFKSVNDALGHHVGDRLLMEVAQRLLFSIRANDSAYRYGGDEFIVLLPEVDGLKGSTELMWKLQNHLSKTYCINNHDIISAASIGIAVYPADGSTPGELIKQADTSMYIEKSSSNTRCKI